MWWRRRASSTEIALTEAKAVVERALNDLVAQAEAAEAAAKAAEAATAKLPLALPVVERCEASGDRLHVAVTSTGGLLHGFSLPGRGAAVHGA